MTGPQPLRLRILGALNLQPMTCAVLARCLGYASRHEQRIVWASLQWLLWGDRVRLVGRAYSLKTLLTREKQ